MLRARAETAEAEVERLTADLEYQTALADRYLTDGDKARASARAWKRAARNQRALAEQAEWAWGGWQERGEAAEAELKALTAALKRINDAPWGEVK